MSTATIRIADGSCHCGAIAFNFHASCTPSSSHIRACQCSFCRRHGARTTSDPAGHVSFPYSRSIKTPTLPIRSSYRRLLGMSQCGVYLAAVLTSPRGRFATLNVNTNLPSLEVASQSISYDEESLEQRQQRRELHWTPVLEPPNPAVNTDADRRAGLATSPVTSIVGRRRPHSTTGDADDYRLYYVHLPKPITREEARSIFLSTAPKYRGVQGLFRKIYVLSEDGATAGGVYLWNSRSEAEAMYTESWRSFVRQKYGTDPTVTYFESPVVVDNVAQQVLTDE